MAESKVVALGGRHKSVNSMLTEMMGDPSITRAVVFGFTKEGDMYYCHYNITAAELSFVGAVALHKAATNDMGEPQ